jgi:hypothetical protein
VTIQEFQARKIERNAYVLAHFVATTPEDKLDWCPATGTESCARSVLSQIGECIGVNRRFTAVLQGKEPPPRIEEYHATSAQAQMELMESAKELADVVRTLPDSALSNEYPGPRGPMPGEVVIDLPNRNMNYHGGQVNLIQLLLGDAEFHVPPPPQNR